MVLHGILLAWLVCKVFKTVAPTVETKWFWIVAQYAAVCFLGSAFVMFARLYVKGRPLSAPAGILLNIPPAFFLAMIATNERHHLFYATYNFRGDTFGPMFYAYSAFTYACLAAGIYMCATCFRRQSGKKNPQARMLSLGIIVPLVVNALYVCGLTEPRFDITPVSTNISLLLFAYAIYKYQFLDVVPLGITTSLDNLRLGVMVAEDGGRILYMNNAFRRMLGLVGAGEPADAAGAILARMAARCKNDEIITELAGALNDGRDEVSFEACFGVPGHKDRHLIIQARRLPKRHGKNAPYLVVLHDNTKYRELILRLEKKNRDLAAANEGLREYTRDLRRLAVAEERNRMAGEIHDVLGHSLTLILNILESGAILAGTDPASAWVKAGQASSHAERGIEELGRLNTAKRRMRSSDQLKLALNQLAANYESAGLAVELIVKGYKDRMPAEHYHTLFRIGQEALTNALRHGRADRADVILRFKPDEAEIFVLDNGRGCALLQEGHGLRNMGDRVRRLRGALLYGAAEGGGFTVHARIPL